jgi:hypothetical protein
MEPVSGRSGDEVTVRTGTDQPAARLATCDDHGPPVVWELGLDQPIG